MVLLVALGRDYTRKIEIVDWENKDRDRAQFVTTPCRRYYGGCANGPGM
jgi:hypothetical protein